MCNEFLLVSNRNTIKLTYFKYLYIRDKILYMFGWLSTVKYSDKYDRIIPFRNYILILISQHYFVILIKRKPYENIFLCLTLIWFLNKKKTRYVDYQHWLCDVKQVTWSTQMVSLKQSFSNTVLGTPEQSYNNNDGY